MCDEKRRVRIRHTCLIQITIPNIGLCVHHLLDRRPSSSHQPHGGIGHGIGCCQQHGIGGMHVPAGDAVRLVAEQAGDGRLVIAEIGGKTGEAVAQHMRRDVGWKITQLGDPQPHLPIADRSAPPDRLANTTSPILGWDWITVQASSDKGRSDAPVLVSASRAVRRGRSISDHRRPSTSPRRHPVRIISHVAAMAGFQTSSCPPSTAPCQAAGTRHRSAVVARRPSANRTTPCAGLSIRRPWRTA